MNGQAVQSPRYGEIISESFHCLRIARAVAGRAVAVRARENTNGNGASTAHRWPASRRVCPAGCELCQRLDGARTFGGLYSYSPHDLQNLVSLFLKWIYLSSPLAAYLGLRVPRCSTLDKMLHIDGGWLRAKGSCEMWILRLRA